MHRSIGGEPGAPAVRQAAQPVEATRSLSSALTGDFGGLGALELDGVSARVGDELKDLLARGQLEAAVAFSKKVLRHPEVNRLREDLRATAARVLLERGFPDALELTPEELELARQSPLPPEVSRAHAMFTRLAMVLSAIAVTFGVVSLSVNGILGVALLYLPVLLAAYTARDDSTRWKRVRLAAASLPLLGIFAVATFFAAQSRWSRAGDWVLVAMALAVFSPAFFAFAAAVWPAKKS